MKKIVVLMLLVGVNVIYANIKNKSENKIRQQLKQQAIDLCVDSLVYAQAGVSPWNGRYPLAKRLMQWKVTADALSDEDRQALIKPVQKDIDDIFRSAVSNGKLDTPRRVADFTGAIEGVFCHLTTYECPLCQELLDFNVTLIKNSEQGAAERNKINLKQD